MEKPICRQERMMPEATQHSRMAGYYVVLNKEVKGEKAEAMCAINPSRIRALGNSFHFTHNSYFCLVSAQPKNSFSADVI